MSAKSATDDSGVPGIFQLVEDASHLEVNFDSMERTHGEPERSSPSQDPAGAANGANPGASNGALDEPPEAGAILTGCSEERPTLKESEYVTRLIDLKDFPGKRSFNFSDRENVYIFSTAGSVIRSSLKFVGGHNVGLLGLDIRPASKTFAASLGVTGVTGSIIIDKVYIDNKESGHQDGISIGGACGARPDVMVRNSVIQNITGEYAKVHGDVLQPYGPVGKLELVNVYGSSNYQGLFLSGEKNFGPTSLELTKVTLAYTAGGDPFTYLLWINGAKGAPAIPVRMRGLLLDERSGQDAAANSMIAFHSDGNRINIERSDNSVWVPSPLFDGVAAVGRNPHALRDLSTKAGLNYDVTKFSTLDSLDWQELRLWVEASQ